MIVFPETPKEVCVRKRTIAIGITSLALLLAGCLLSSGCSVGQKAAWDSLLNPAAKGVQDKATEDKLAGNEWSWEDLLTALGVSVVGYLGTRTVRKGVLPKFVDPPVTPTK